MGSLMGNLFLAVCICFAMGMLLFNVVFYDNVIPQVLDQFTAILPTPEWAHAGNAIMWIAIARVLSVVGPLMVGMIVWFSELGIFGRGDTYT